MNKFYIQNKNKIMIQDIFDIINNLKYSEKFDILDLKLELE